MKRNMSSLENSSISVSLLIHQCIYVTLECSWRSFRHDASLRYKKLPIEVPGGVLGTALSLHVLPDFGSILSLDTSNLHKNSWEFLRSGEFGHLGIVVILLTSKFETWKAKND